LNRGGRGEHGEIRDKHACGGAVLLNCVGFSLTTEITEFTKSAKSFFAANVAELNHAHRKPPNKESILQRIGCVNLRVLRVLRSHPLSLENGESSDHTENV
jgi:hypothetical protein